MPLSIRTKDPQDLRVRVVINLPWEKDCIRIIRVRPVNSRAALNVSVEVINVQVRFTSIRSSDYVLYNRTNSVVLSSSLICSTARRTAVTRQHNKVAAVVRNTEDLLLVAFLTVNNNEEWARISIRPTSQTLSLNEHVARVQSDSRICRSGRTPIIPKTHQTISSTTNVYVPCHPVPLLVRLSGFHSKPVACTEYTIPLS